jgi:hypothetical protein
MNLEEKVKMLEEEAKQIEKWVNIHPLVYASLIDIMTDLEKIKSKLEIK